MQRCIESLRNDTQEIGKHKLSPERAGWPRCGWEGNIISTVGAPELHTHHFLNIFPKYPPAPSVHQVPSCVQHRPSPVPSSSFCFPIGNTACPLRSWARLLVVLSSLYLPYQSPPRACQYSVPPACSHSLSQPLLSVPTVPAPAQASPPQPPGLHQSLPFRASPKRLTGVFLTSRSDPAPPLAHNPPWLPFNLRKKVPSLASKALVNGAPPTTSASSSLLLSSSPLRLQSALTAVLFSQNRLCFPVFGPLLKQCPLSGTPLLPPLSVSQPFRSNFSRFLEVKLQALPPLEVLWAVSS